MSDMQRQSIGLALGRLRFAVAVCCWVAVLALGLQVLIWSVVNFTDVRFRTLEGGSEGPLIVESPSAREQTMRTISVGQSEADASRTPVETNRVLSRWDRVMASAVMLTRGAGLLAMLAMIPMIAMGVLLGAGSATPGVESTVSSFTWATLTALLILPVGAVVDLPWYEGGLVGYELMVQQSGFEAGGVVAMARFVALPAVCIAGLVLVALRFSAGVRTALLPRDDLRLDPELEKEVAGIKPGSLMGGRAAGALSQAVKTEQPARATGSPVPSVPRQQPAGESSIPRAREVSPGEAPKRLI